ncbi:MAG: hypothetical protein J0H47_00140 [Gammaproteobacteria bacterium]|nr:hypothetical protein [Gammaproteobacteria bacterium]
MTNENKLLVKEEKEYDTITQIMLASHASLLNFVALLSTGGLALLLAWHANFNVEIKAHVFILFLISIYLILIVKFLFFIQNSLILISIRKNLHEIKSEKITEEQLKLNKLSQREVLLEITLDVAGYVSILSFLIGASMWTLGYFHCQSLILKSYRRLPLKRHIS